MKDDELIIVVIVDSIESMPCDLWQSLVINMLIVPINYKQKATVELNYIHCDDEE